MIDCSLLQQYKRGSDFCRQSRFIGNGGNVDNVICHSLLAAVNYAFLVFFPLEESIFNLGIRLKLLVSFNTKVYIVTKSFDLLKNDFQKDNCIKFNVRSERYIA
jgi:hypothetical protein